MPLPPIHVLHLFPGERAALLALLRSLEPDEWRLPTACEGWTVHDVARHLLGDDLGKLSASRDGHRNPDFASGLDTASFSGLVAAINRQNDLWVRATRRLSTELTISLLETIGAELFAHMRTFDLDQIGGAVEWSGPDPAPIWFDVAREYTERWHHQQHIRDAVGRPGLMEEQWSRPVFETFLRGLKRSLLALDRAVGSTLSLTIVGAGGGVWIATRGDTGWDLAESEASHRADAAVVIPAAVAWKVFTNGIGEDDARALTEVQGDDEMVMAVFRTVSILAR